MSVRARRQRAVAPQRVRRARVGVGAREEEAYGHGERELLDGAVVLVVAIAVHFACRSEGCELWIGWRCVAFDARRTRHDVWCVSADRIDTLTREVCS